MSKIFEIVKKHIDAYDYSCLLEGGAPLDEFDSESYKISERISCNDTSEEIAEIMAMVFQMCFGREEKPEAFIEVAKSVANDMKEEQSIILEESKDMALEMARLIYQQTNDKKFTRNMLFALDSEYERKQMIAFIKKNNPDLRAINHFGFELEMGVKLD